MLRVEGDRFGILFSIFFRCYRVPEGPCFHWWYRWISSSCRERGGVVRRVSLVWESFVRFFSTCLGYSWAQFRFLVRGKVFLSLVSVFPCGAGGFSLRAGSVAVRVVVRSSFGSVSSDRV